MIGIQIGENTHTQDQVITPQILRTIKTIPKISQKPKPVNLYSFIQFSPPMLHILNNLEDKAFRLLYTHNSPNISLMQ